MRSIGRIVYKCGKIFNTNICNSKFYSTLSYIHNNGSEPLQAKTVGGLLEETAAKYGDIEAVISEHQNLRVTFQNALAQADKLAASLRKLGVQPGDRVGICMPNIVEWYLSYMACARAGFIVVTINPAYQPREIKYCINKVGIRTLICSHKLKSQNFYDILNIVSPKLSNSEPGHLSCDQVPTLQHVVIVTDDTLRGVFHFDELMNASTEPEILNIGKSSHKIKIDDPFNIQFTSGTTGFPKAAVQSHFQIVNNGYVIGKRVGLNNKQHKLCMMVPFFHAFGTIINMSAALNHGGTLVLPSETFNAVRSLDAIEKEKCTLLLGTPTMYVDLVELQKKAKKSINPEVAVTGGAICSPTLFKDMLGVLNIKKVTSVYGLTECTAVVFQSRDNDDFEQSTSTVGYVSDHVEAKVVDDDDRIVPRGTPGELLLRGYFTMLGYWQDEEKTKEIIGDDKWLRTGDIFILRPDGYGTVVGRAKEMIIRGGENIFPREIEDFLVTHPHIIEVHVIGVPHERLGEEVCACIKVKNRAQITLEDVQVYCNGEIAHFKIPSILKVVEEFPKTGSGKIQKFKLLELVVNQKI